MMMMIFFNGLLTTESDVLQEETTVTSVPPTVPITESKMLKAITVKDFPDAVTALVTPVIPSAPVLPDPPLEPSAPVLPVPLLEPSAPVLPSDSAVAAVKDRDVKEEEDQMNMDIFPTNIVNHTLEDFHDRDELTE